MIVKNNDEYFIGPIPLPIIGNILSFRNNGLETALTRWRKQYGDVMTVWMGSLPVVTIHDCPTIFETFLKDGETYTGRYITPGFTFIRGGYNGVIITDGELWKEHRRFAIHVLKDFGLGKNLMQEKILTEVTSLIADIKEDIKGGKLVIPILDDIDRTVGSIINVFAFGYRFGRDKEDEFQKNKQNIQALIKHATNPLWRTMEHHVDIMKHLPVFSSTAKQVKEDSIAISKFYLDQIEIHKKKINFNTNNESTDYVEAFLRHQHKLEKLGQKDHTYT